MIAVCNQANSYSELITCFDEERMKYCITIERDENGFYIVKVPAIPECVSKGRTAEEALEESKKVRTGYIKKSRQDKSSPPKFMETV